MKKESCLNGGLFIAYDLTSFFDIKGIDKMLYGDNEKKIIFNICRMFANIKDKLEVEMI